MAKKRVGEMSGENEVMLSEAPEGGIPVRKAERASVDAEKRESQLSKHAEIGKKIENKATKAPSPVKIQKPSVTLRVFEAVSGIKPDQFKPFTSFAKREEFRPCSVPEWQERFKQFLNRKV